MRHPATFGFFALRDWLGGGSETAVPSYFFEEAALGPALPETSVTGF